MVATLRGKGSARLWRLYAVACTRRVETWMRYRRSQDALDVAERFADGTATVGELNSARALAEEAAHQAHHDAFMDEVRAQFRWDSEYAAVVAAASAADAALQ